MDQIRFAVLGTGGIGRRTLEVSTRKDALTPVAACDRNGIALDHDGLDVQELLDATEGNIASDGGSEASQTGPYTDGGAAVKQHGDQQGVAASRQATATETPIEDLRETFDLAEEGFEMAVERYEEAYEKDELDEAEEDGETEEGALEGEKGVTENELGDD